ncbi:MAG: hypothetical protein JNL65_08175 [Saprospiraceae bacterium]|nr:hypothetical protein [Saprospiraceae bacterium]
MFNKGDILLPSNNLKKNDWLNGLFHPAVVWDQNYNGKSDFRGIMITHTSHSANADNILMAANHFENGYPVRFTNSHFVNKIFIKFHFWGPFELVGRLTAEGMNFIERNLDTSIDPIQFTIYRDSLIAN